MVVSRFKDAKQLKDLIVTMPVGPMLHDEDTGTTQYLGTVIPTQIDPRNLLLSDLTGTTNPGYQKAQDAIEFVEATLAPFDADLDYKLRENKKSPDYQYLIKMVKNYGNKP